MAEADEVIWVCVDAGLLLMSYTKRLIYIGVQLSSYIKVLISVFIKFSFHLLFSMLHVDFFKDRPSEPFIVLIFDLTGVQRIDVVCTLIIYLSYFSDRDYQGVSVQCHTRLLTAGVWT